VVREDRPGEPRLVAYVVSPAGAEPSAAELRRFLEERFPDHMVPSAFQRLEAFPHTATGKVDRRSLPAPDPARRDVEGPLAAPRTPLEKALAAIWADVLHLERVGIYDNFFELGGHSLLATQVVARARQSLSVELPLHLLFERPTVAELAVAIAQNCARRAEPEELARILEELEGHSDGTSPTKT